MYDYAIIFENDTSPTVTSLSEALKELGLSREVSDTLDSDLLFALNSYRKSNSMPPLDFCEPTVLRHLGIDASGDELITLALAATELASTEIEYYDVCLEIVRESREFGITVTEACARRDAIGRSHTDLSESAVRAAVLAYLNG